MDTISDLILQNIHIYVYGGFISVIAWLIITGHASLSTNADNNHRGCGDTDVQKGQGVQFGGASSLTFGWHYFALASMSVSAPLLTAYAWFQFWLSVVQGVFFLISLVGMRGQSVVLKSHDKRCGWTLAWGMFWPLYFISEFLWFLKPVLVPVADVITLIDFVVSLPANIVIMILAKVIFGVSVELKFESITRVKHQKHVRRL